MQVPAGAAPIAESLRDYARAMAGGLLIGLPLLFTQEIWDHGFLLHPLKILVLLGLAFIVIVGYTAVSGFRQDLTWRDLFIDSVESLGLGLIVALGAFLLIGRIELDIGSREAVGKMALAAIPIAFGASLARSQLSEQPEDGADEPDRQPSSESDTSDRSHGDSGTEAATHQETERTDRDTASTDQGAEAVTDASRGTDAPDEADHTGRRRTVGPFGRLFVAAGGALLFAINVAPTEEPVLIAAEIDWLLILLLMSVSLIVTFVLVFYADFVGSQTERHGSGLLERPIAETVAAYAISLGVSLLLLWAFGYTDGMGLATVLKTTVVLGLVASFGAAVGRLVVGSATDEPEEA